MHIITADPLLTLLQMAVLQSAYYSILVLAASATSMVFLSLFDSAHVISSTASLLSIDSSLSGGQKAILCVAHSVATPCMVLVVYLVVDHGSKVLDFVITLFAWHLLSTWAVAHFPTSSLWWGIAAVEAVTLSALGEYYCARRDCDTVRQLVANIEDPSHRKAGAAPALRADVV